MMVCLQKNNTGDPIMPFINIEVSGTTVTQNQINQITTNMTQIMAKTAHKQAALTSVRIGQGTANAWSIGGQIAEHAVRAHMDIHVTQGTNDDTEIADLVRLGHGELEQAFGSLDDATYVIVHEHPAMNWGYGGRTQGARKSDPG